MEPISFLLVKKHLTKKTPDLDGFTGEVSQISEG